MPEKNTCSNCHNYRPTTSMEGFCRATIPLTIRTKDSSCPNRWVKKSESDEKHPVEVIAN